MRPHPRWLISVGIVLALALLAMVVAYGCRRPQGPAVVIDFTDTIDSRVVYPLTQRTDIVTRPERIELRFPGGRIYRSEDAREVWIQRGGVRDHDLIEEVSVNTGHLTLDEAYRRANRLREHWGFPPDPELERWLQDRLRHGPGEWSIDMAGRDHRITDADRDGKRLTVGFGIRGDRHFDPPYQLIESFHWFDPESG